MKVSLNWLKDYIAVKIPADTLAQRLTMAGLEVEKIHSAQEDKIFEIEVTPNRPDCLNMIGISREVSAILQKKRVPLKFRKLKSPSAKCPIEIQDKAGCPRYIGTLIKGIDVAPVPEWIRRCIESVDMRAVNNIVDITNFCLMETGQPMHAFDYDKLEGGKIVVRRARQGEKIVTIDGVTRELDPSILVIADTSQPVAIAGIMGGKGTEVTDETKNILLESAYFDPTLIRRASRKLGLSSDSAYRFERQVDYDMVEQGAARAVALIMECAGGKVAGRSDVTVKQSKKEKSGIALSLPEINNFLGANLSANLCKKILQYLDFDVTPSKGSGFVVVPPSFRNDIKQAVDVIEELARVVGYDNLPMGMPLVAVTAVEDDRAYLLKNELANNLVAQGFNEIVTYSMISSELVAGVVPQNTSVSWVKNPLTKEQEILRPSLLPGMLTVATSNMKRGVKTFRFFEIGKTYLAGKELPVVGLLMSGLRRNDWRETQKVPVQFYDMKGAMEEIFSNLRVDSVKFSEGIDGSIQAGEGCRVFKGNTELGFAGKVAEGLLTRFDVRTKDCYFAQINLAAVFAEQRPVPKYAPVSGCPFVERDLSVAVKDETKYQEIIDIIKNLGTEILQSVTFKEEYLGDKIEKGFRSITVTLTYQSLKRTLTEEEVDRVNHRIRQALQGQLQGILR